jgi:hypothetical protein
MQPDVGAAKDKVTVFPSLWKNRLSLGWLSTLLIISKLVRFGASASRQRFFMQFLRGFLGPTRHRLKD